MGSPVSFSYIQLPIKALDTGSTYSSTHYAGTYVVQVSGRHKMPLVPSREEGERMGVRGGGRREEAETATEKGVEQGAGFSRLECEHSRGEADDTRNSNDGDE